MISLKNLASATAQEVFDQVARHLLTQMEKCQIEIEYPHNTHTGLPERIGKNGSLVRVDYRCKYRAGDLKCAAGCLIADDEYSALFEDHDWYGLVVEGHVPFEHQGLITDLQRLHDRNPPHEWREALFRLAKVKNLKMDVFAEFPE